ASPAQRAVAPLQLQASAVARPALALAWVPRREAAAGGSTVRRSLANPQGSRARASPCRSPRRRAGAEPERRAAAAARAHCAPTDGYTHQPSANRRERPQPTNPGGTSPSSCLGEEQPKRRSQPWSRLYLNFSVVHLHRAVDHRQTDPAALVLGREIEVEDFLQVLGLDTDTRVRERDADPPATH